MLRIGDPLQARFGVAMMPWGAPITREGDPQKTTNPWPRGLPQCPRVTGACRLKRAQRPPSSKRLLQQRQEP